MCQRAYRILVEEVGFNPQDVIFDPNILTVGTGLAEHNNYAVDFILATREIKRVCPGAKISGGVSNIAFSFRGNEAVRRGFHSAFLHHACLAGMDMGIVNAAQVKEDVYSKVDAELLTYVEDVLLNRRDDATERMLEFAATLEPKVLLCFLTSCSLLANVCIRNKQVLITRYRAIHVQQLTFCSAVSTTFTPDTAVQADCSAQDWRGCRCCWPASFPPTKPHP